MIDLIDPGLVFVRCAKCGDVTAAANLTLCFICDQFDDVCGECLVEHFTQSHTQIEYLKAQMELTV